MDIDLYLEGKNIFYNILTIDPEHENEDNSELENGRIIHSNKILDNSDNNEMISENSDFNNSIFSIFLSSIKSEVKPTNFSSNNQTQKIRFSVNKEEIETPKIKRDEIPKIISINEINNIIRLYDIGSELKKKLFFSKETNSKEIELIKEELEANSFRRKKKLKINIYLKAKYAQGRKKMNDNSYRSHNKNNSDNIICKLLNRLNESLLDFINGIINAVKTKEEIIQILFELNLPIKIKKQNSIELIKKNDYKFRWRYKKIDKFLELLDYSLKDYFSLEISPKFKDIRYFRNCNELILNKLLEKENNNNYQLFDFILNGLKISDYFDLFLHQKNFEGLNKFDNYNSLNTDQKEMIKNNLKGIEKYFEKEDKTNFHCFALVAYNLKRLLFIKEVRKSKKWKNRY